MGKMGRSVFFVFLGTLLLAAGCGNVPQEQGSNTEGINGYHALFSKGGGGAGIPQRSLQLDENSATINGDTENSSISIDRYLNSGSNSTITISTSGSFSYSESDITPIDKLVVNDGDQINTFDFTTSGIDLSGDGYDGDYVTITITYNDSSTSETDVNIVDGSWSYDIADRSNIDTIDIEAFYND